MSKEIKIDETTGFCPVCGEDWEMGCSSEMHEDGKVEIQCAKCSREFSYMSKEEIVLDHKNPAYLFSTTDNSLLLAIAKDQLDAVAAAKTELANRGLGPNCAWVGFDIAKKYWESVVYRNGKFVTIPED